MLKKTIPLMAVIIFASPAVSQESGSVEVTPDKIFSNFECKVNAPMDKVFAALSDVTNHSQILSNIVSRTIVDPSDLGSVLKGNEVLTVSTVVEPEERLALALFRFFPPNRIEEEMLTDPFDGANSANPEPLDRKKGSIAWDLEPAGEGTLIIVQSEFAPKTGRVYSEERVNAIWSTHCEMLEAEANSR